MTRLSPIMKISQVFSNCPPTDCKKEEEKEEEEKFPLPLPNVTAPPVIVTGYLNFVFLNFFFVTLFNFVLSTSDW